jgi:hypothetical protein
MRVFLLSVLTVLVMGAIGLFALGTAQRSAAVAYSTDGARINPKWSFRTMLKKPDNVRAGQAAATNPGVNPANMGAEGAIVDQCELGGALRWLSVDFGEAVDEGGCA